MCGGEGGQISSLACKKKQKKRSYQKTLHGSDVKQAWVTHWEFQVRKERQMWSRGHAKELNPTLSLAEIRGVMVSFGSTLEPTK